MSIADDYVAAFEPWITDDLEIYLRAIGSMFGQVEELAFDTDDHEGWAHLLDPDLCPAYALPYLAQYVGERLPTGISEAAAREWIKDAPNQRRGTLGSIVAAAARYLTGQKAVTVIERDGGADKLTVVTYMPETANSGAVLAELMTVVPADISLTYTVAAGQLWTQVEATHASWSLVKSDYATWADMAADTPSGTYGE